VRKRAEQILAWANENKPDMIALQETKVQDKDFPLDTFEQQNWKVHFRGEKSYNGVALLSRVEPDEVRFGMGDDHGESETRLLLARFGEFYLLNTYVPQGRALDSPQFTFKLEWLGRLKKFLEPLINDPKSNLLWTGDLNVAPEPIDVYDHKKIWPHVCHCQDVVDAFNEIKQLGFVDLFRKHIPQDDVFTFWDYRVKNALDRGMGWRIDHFLATPALAEKSEACFVDTKPRRQKGCSDHTMVALDFT
jgi:exodeoxyribonuclease-3